MAMSMHPRETWQVAFDLAKRQGRCDFDASRYADQALADMAAWEAVKIDAPPPVKPRFQMAGARR